MNAVAGPGRSVRTETVEVSSPRIEQRHPEQAGLPCVKDTIRVSSFERYKSIVELHISPAHVRGFYRGRLDSGLSPASDKVHVVLHESLSQAVKWSLIPRNVTVAVSVPRPVPKEMRPLSAKRSGSCWGAPEATTWRLSGCSRCIRV